MTFVFVVAREGGMNPGLRWQVGCSVADHLDARVLVMGDDRDVARTCLGGVQSND